MYSPPSINNLLKYYVLNVQVKTLEKFLPPKTAEDRKKNFMFAGLAQVISDRLLMSMNWNGTNRATKMSDLRLFNDVAFGNCIPYL